MVFITSVRRMLKPKGGVLYDIKDKNLTWCRQIHFLRSQRVYEKKFSSTTNRHHGHTYLGLRNKAHHNILGGRVLHKQYRTLPGLSPLLHCVRRGYASSQKIDDDLLLKYLESLNQEYNGILEAYMKGDKGHALNSRKVFLTPLVTLYTEIKDKYKELEELKQLSADDADMKSMAEDEIDQIQQYIESMKQQVLDNLVPDMKYDKNDVILEITPGVGGEEAKLFTLDLYEMYSMYAGYKGWTYEPEILVSSDNGGLSKARVLIGGYDVFKWLKYESGTHRVQRVPKTERGGRIHTSTSSVALLPKPNEIDITIDPKDLNIDTYKASGAGGQHVNTTDSAVRVTHTPSGIVTSCQEGRSQISNRKIAIERLRTRLYEKEFNEQMNKITSQRKLQVGTAGRSEKIRTYNYGQNRVTDHRIHHSCNDVLGFLSGGHTLDDFIQKLLEESRKETLIEMLEEFEKKS